MYETYSLTLLQFWENAKLSRILYFNILFMKFEVKEFCLFGYLQNMFIKIIAIWLRQRVYTGY